MLDVLRGRAERICDDGVRLLKEFSGMHKMEVNTTVSRQYWEVWNDLPTGGKQIQTRLLTEVDRFSELVRTLTRNLPSTPQADLKV